MEVGQVMYIHGYAFGLGCLAGIPLGVICGWLVIKVLDRVGW